MRATRTGRVRGITVRVACAQLAARPALEAAESLADIVRSIRSAKRAAADIVVLPECSYPGYVLVDGNPYAKKIPTAQSALTTIAREARRLKLAVAVGIARHDSRGRLRNEAVFIDRCGEQVGAYAKSRLWNFDQRWFVRGNELPVLQTEFGTLAMMICADGRNPEIARTLVAQGAWMILDPTAWVGFGPTYSELRNVQADYALRVRALENGVWIAAADKCGSELGAVHYAGRSQIVAPDGHVVALAGAAKAQLIVADVRRAKPKPVVVALSARDRATLRSQRSRAFVNGRVPPRLWLGIYQSAPGVADDRLALAALKAQSANALIRSGATIAATERALRRARGLRWAILGGKDMLAPEPARAQALRGADLVVWMQPPKRLPLLLEIARTRAMENRTYVALCTQTDEPVATCLIGPDGAVIASAIAGKLSGFVAAIDTLSARRKEVVPGTQTFADRTPSLYQWLSRT